MDEMMPGEPPGALEELAAELEPTSPGFAMRLRQFEIRVRPAQSPEAFSEMSESLARVVQLEGVAREAGLALLTLETDQVVLLPGLILRHWADAICDIGSVSVRAAQSFGAAALVDLPGAELAVGQRLVDTAGALREFVEAHPGEPIVNRCATFLGEAFIHHPTSVHRAWLRYASAVAFTPRRPLDVLRELPKVVALESEELAGVLNVVARCASWDIREAPEWFSEAPRLLSGIPPDSRGRVLEVLDTLGSDALSILDLLRGAGPVLRRLSAPERHCVLAHTLAIAQSAPKASPRFLRSVLRVGEAVGFEDDLRVFVEEGLSLAEMQEVAAEAFFSLESRGAKAFLARHDTAVRFEDIETTLRGYLRILERKAPNLVAVELGGLFPFLDNRNTIPVSNRTGTFPTWEENFILLKLQATLATLWGEAGTRDFSVGQWLSEDVEGGFRELYARFEYPEAAAGILAHVEAARLAPWIRQRFPGLAGDLADLRAHAFRGDCVSVDAGEPEALLFLALGGSPDDIEFGPGRAALEGFARRAADGLATIYESVDETARMSRLLEEGELIRVTNVEDLFLEDPTMSYLLDDADEDGGPPPPAPPNPDVPQMDEENIPQGERSEDTSPATAVDPELLKAYLEQNPKVKVMRSEESLDATGLFVAGLTGGGGERPDQMSPAEREHVFALSRGAREARGVYLYDEWDHEISDYRVSWCQVHELGLGDDDPAFFSETLQRYQDVLPEVRRQFQRVKPQGYRTIRGLLDGEDFDLDAVVLARSDLRAKLNPATRLYTQRQREERDVATLFLLDMSASTDEEVEKPEAPPELPEDLSDTFLPPDSLERERGRRVIDIQKEALTIMSQALEEIGDLFSIFGFSGHGRERVELFDVKSFDESLSLAVKSRLSAIEPQRSTRMGPAIRHSIRRLASVSSRSKHLILLSDGFPQDFDYGRDRRSNLYGLRDTAQALREAEQAGISTFCITVDRAGNDYLREMCDDDRYLVIEDIAELPLELPKIYSRATRDA